MLLAQRRDQRVDQRRDRAPRRQRVGPRIGAPASRRPPSRRQRAEPFDRLQRCERARSRFSRAAGSALCAARGQRVLALEPLGDVFDRDREADACASSSRSGAIATRCCMRSKREPARAADAGNEVMVQAPARAPGRRPVTSGSRRIGQQAARFEVGDDRRRAAGRPPSRRRCRSSPRGRRPSCVIDQLGVSREDADAVRGRVPPSHRPGRARSSAAVRPWALPLVPAAGGRRRVRAESVSPASSSRMLEQIGGAAARLLDAADVAIGDRADVAQLLEQRAPRRRNAARLASVISFICLRCVLPPR